MKNKYYVYIHRKLSDGGIFYVGKGSGRRAYDQSRRTAWWKSVVKRHGVNVEILAKDLTESDAFNLERDTIKLYKSLGFTLVNLTEGGEGASGYKYEGEKLVRLQKHIKNQYQKLSDKNVYTFYHFSGQIFTGTRMEFCKNYSILSKDVAKLFQTKNKRSVVKNWSLSPIKIKVRNKNELICPAKRSSNVCTKVYTFYHVLGESFSGTRSEFSDYSQISLSYIAGLFCKNPRRTVYGWALTKIDPATYTHLKI